MTVLARLGASLALLVPALPAVAQQVSYLYEYPVATAVATDQVAVIAATNPVDIDATSRGQPNALPLPVMQAAITQLHAVGRGAVLNGENPVKLDTLVDPVSGGPVLHRATQTPATAAETFRGRVLRATFAGGATVDLGRGPDYFIESGQATVFAPHRIPDLPNQSVIVGGVPELLYEWQVAGSTAPASGVRNLGSGTSWDFALSGAPVRLFGLVYNNWDNFQSEPYTDGRDRVLFRVKFASGLERLYASNTLNRTKGLFDTFFGVEAPAGDSIASVQLWTHGRNSRVFSALDDLVVGLGAAGDVAVTVSTVGQGSVSGAGTRPAGTTGALVATPAEGHEFVGWRHVGAAESWFSRETTVEVAPWTDRAYEAVFKPVDPYRLVLEGVASPNEVTVTPYQRTYAAGTVVTLVARPAESHVFGGWTGAVTGTTTTATVTLDADKTVAATFTPRAYTVALTYSGTNAATLDALGENAVAVSVNGTPLVPSSPSTAAASLVTQLAATPLAFGDTVRVEALRLPQPPAARLMQGVRGVDSAPGNPATVPVRGTNASVSVQVVYGNAWPLSAPVANGSGTVSMNREPGTYLNDNRFVVTATPGEGQEFVEWQGIAAGDYLSGTTANSPRAEFRLRAATAPVAVFAAGYKLQVVANPPAAGRTSGSRSYAAGATGTNVAIRADAAAGWVFDRWVGPVTAGTGDGTYATGTVASVTEATTVEAMFVELNAITATASPAGKGTITGAGTFRADAGTTLTALPATGWTFSRWTGDVPAGLETANPLTVDATVDRAIVAEFAAIPYTLTVTTTGAGRVKASPAAATYTYGDTVLLTADPAWGQGLAGWGGAVTSTANPLSVQVLGDTAITATFAPVLEWAQHFMNGDEVDGPAVGYNWNVAFGAEGALIPQDRWQGTTDPIWGVSNGPGETDAFSGKPNRLGFLYAIDPSTATPPPGAWFFFTDFTGEQRGFVDNLNPQALWASSARGGRPLAGITVGEIAGLSVYTRPGTTTDAGPVFRFALKVDGAWYASADTFRFPAGSPNWERQAFPAPASVQWVPGVYAPGALDLDLADATPAALPTGGVVQGYGLYADTGELDGSASRVRLDTFRVLTRVASHPVAWSAGAGGAVDGPTPDQYAAGASLRFVASPLSGHGFVAWSGTVPAGQEGNATLDVLVTGPVNLVAAFERLGFAGWIEGYPGLPADRRGPLDDPDADGIPNLLEFALGLDPSAGGAGGIPAPTVERVGDTDVLVYRFTRGAEAVDAGIAFTVELAPDLALGPWSDASVGAFGATVETVGATTAVRLPLSAEKVHLRLRVAIPGG